MWSFENLSSESDVEQKFIYPLLTQKGPYGFGYPPSIIETKVNIRKYSIGKGTEQKLYFPDYILANLGLPFLVIEAKKPNENVAEGYRQARLYATELNTEFPHEINPVKYIISTDGIDFWLGFSDSKDPKFKLKCSNLGVYSNDFNDILNELKWSNIELYLKEVTNQFSPNGLFKVRKLLGGGQIQNEEIGTNNFSSTVTSTISHIFNPKTLEDRKTIVKEAYVSSKRRERYIDPIDKVIRAAKAPYEINSLLIEDTETPNELINKLRDTKQLENKILLIIGSVGSGKTTFIDYLQYESLPKEIIDTTVWCRLDMNNAPVSNDEIYSWLRREIVKSCKASMPEVDFDDLEIIQKVYGAECSKFRKGIGKLYIEGSEKYNEEFAKFLQKQLEDSRLEAINYVKYTCTNRQKFSIIVLDNCDKKNRDEQLLMFQASQWLQKEFKSLVILPLRDETYDNHRHEPPLDTLIKDMVFRIEPPLFQHVLTNRINLALKGLGNGSKDVLNYRLPNGFQVNYPKSEQSFYLISILKSLFEHDRFARRLIVGLAGRNVRKALEMFLEFCNSAYISDDYILKIRKEEGKYVLPAHLVATVLLRMNRRYYDGDHSFVKNIFNASNEDVKPDYFSRFLILRWLKDKHKDKGDARVTGYFKKETIKNHLVCYGLSTEIIDREIDYLLEANCIVAEHLNTESCLDEDLLRLSPAGFVHLEMIENVNYLAALSEDTYFPDRLTAEGIVAKIKDNIGHHLHVQTTLDNAQTFVDFINTQHDSVARMASSYLEDEQLSKLLDLGMIQQSIDRVRKSKSNDPWFDLDKRLKRGSKHIAGIVNIIRGGLLVEFESGVVGLIGKNENSLNMDNFDLGDSVEVSIKWVDVVQRRIGLKFEKIIDNSDDNILNL